MRRTIPRLYRARGEYAWGVTFRDCRGEKVTVESTSLREAIVNGLRWWRLAGTLGRTGQTWPTAEELAGMLRDYDRLHPGRIGGSTVRDRAGHVVFTTAPGTDTEPTPAP